MSALQPWAVELEQFPRDLALGLHPLIARLDAALGPQLSESIAATSEPDGYAGLDRRGPYTRLLPSEWLLAWELPDEFLRRAASAEHTFLRPAYAQKGGTRRASVLFDAGPRVLGAPRIAQIALLIVLARRARAAKVELRFGALQTQAASWEHAVSPRSVERLLRARSDRLASEDDARNWRAAAEPLVAEDELWLVGGADLVRLDSFARLPRVILEEPMALGERVVRVELVRNRNAKLRLTLPLPARDLCVRLLRDPLDAGHAPLQVRASRFDHTRPIAFSGDCRRLNAFRTDGAIASLWLPHSPRAKPGRTRHFRPGPGERVVGFGSQGRSLFALTQRDDHFFSYGCGASAANRRAEAWITKPDGTPQARAIAEPDGVLLAGNDAFWFWNGAHQVFRLGDRGTRLDRLPPAVLGIARARDGSLVPVRLGHGPESEHERIIAARQGKTRNVGFRLDDHGGRPRVFLGSNLSASCCMAAQYPDGSVWVCRHPGEGFNQLKLPPGLTLHGVIAIDGDVFLVVLDSDRRTLGLIGRSATRTIARAGDAIAQVCVGTTSPHLAWLSERGELVAYSLKQRTVVLRTAEEVAP